MEINIRNATEDDLETIQELNLKLFEKEIKEFDSSLDKNWTFSEKGKSYFTDRIKKGIALIAEVGGAPIGYLVGGEAETQEYRKIGKTAELDNMFVLEKFRQKGVGKALVNGFFKWCKENGYKKIRVDASARNNNAINFYRKLGFADYSISLEKDSIF